MSRPATIFLLIVAPGLAILLVFLGIETLHTNILGWFFWAAPYLSGRGERWGDIIRDMFR